MTTGTLIAQAMSSLWARVLMSTLLSTAVFCCGLVAGPIDRWDRALTVGIIGGALACACARFDYPGWPLFSASLAFIAGGAVQQGLVPYLGVEPWTGSGSLWLAQALLALVAGGAWMLGWWIAQASLQTYLGWEFESFERPFEGWEEAPTAALVRGMVWSALTALAWVPLLIGTYPSLLAVGIPLAALLCGWGCAAFPGLGLVWPVSGTVAGLFLAAFTATGLLPGLASGLGRTPWTTLGSLSYPYDLYRMPGTGPWLALGLLVAGTMLGYWGTVWLQGFVYRIPEGREAQ